MIKKVIGALTAASSCAVLSVCAFAAENLPATPDTPEPTGLSGIISTLTSGVKGVFDIAAKGFDFITSNDLCMFMVSISFAGVALGFVSRAFKTARK